jgi:hypothetical protein
MAAITTRETSGGGATVKNSPLTNAELDTNFININTELVTKATIPSQTSNTGKFLSTDGTNLLWNANIPRVASVASAASIQPNCDTTDQYNVTALAVAASFLVPTGTPVQGQKLLIRLKDNGTARGLTWTTSAGGYRIVGVVLPTTTTANKTTYVGCIYNSTDSFWDVIAVTTEV